MTTTADLALAEAERGVPPAPEDRGFSAETSRHLSRQMPAAAEPGAIPAGDTGVPRPGPAHPGGRPGVWRADPR